MNGNNFSESDVIKDLHRQPHLLLKLAENSLNVAENLRNNYFKNTTTFITHLRKRIYGTSSKENSSILSIQKVDGLNWNEIKGELVSFIDGGIGHIELSNQIPILLRVGSYSVKTGEQRLAEREKFGYYPVILGDLEGGSKERKDFTDIVRITAELLGGLSILENTPDISVLMFHGPLVYLMGQYAGHTPFTEKDINLFLEHYASGIVSTERIKDEFLNEARLDIYPQITRRCDEWVERKLFEPLSWISFLYRRLISEARKRRPVPIIAGVVERGGTLREFSENVLLARVFRSLREKNNINYFNDMYGRSDLKDEKSLLDKLGYTDSLLVCMLLHPGERTESWKMNKYGGLRKGNVSLPQESHSEEVDFSILAQKKYGFPSVEGFYIHVSDIAEPIRVEVFKDLGTDLVQKAAERCYLYARLLPQYGYPVGLDIADKHAKVPSWMTGAYAKLIRHHLGVSLQRGEITDSELRRILVQAIYMTHRDWLFRPKI